jgi:hypothetical protein
MRRIILLGASNLTLAFPLVVETLRATYGPIELFAAHGHGRSYGMTSRVLCRALPGIRGCRLWDDLRSRPPSTQPPLAVITDVGNDLLYGATAPQIVGWVETCLARLIEQGATVVVTGLPLVSVMRLGPMRYSLTKAIFFPGKGPTWAAMRDFAPELHRSLAQLAARQGVPCIDPRAEWYGFDPIHIRRSRRPVAWREILSRLAGNANCIQIARPGPVGAARCWRAAPALRSICGRARKAAQPALSFPDGSTISLY